MRSTSVPRRCLLFSLVLVIAAVTSACGEAGNGRAGIASEGNADNAEGDTGDVPSTLNSDCIPGDAAGDPLVQPDRRIEDIIFHLTGERQTGDLDPVEETIDDPNFGGVWGDFAGGVVVAVLDCSAVDADEIARIAGGPGQLNLIEVSHTFRQVDEFRDMLAHELGTIGVRAELLIDSTLTGRHITVQLPDPSQLGDGFGSAVPDHLFSVTEGGLFEEQ